MFTNAAKDFNDTQRQAVFDLGTRSMLDIQCSNLVNPVCEWLGSIYEPKSREFVIPGRGRLPLDEESVFDTLGVPMGHIPVPYMVDNDVQERLFPNMFPGHEAIPLTTTLATSLAATRSSGDVFKRKCLMLLISTVFAPTTSTRPSNRCFPILVGLFLFFFIAPVYSKCMVILVHITWQFKYFIHGKSNTQYMATF